MAPVFEQLSRMYNHAVFLKVDVDVCQETAAAQGVSSMPTFIFFRNRVIISATGNSCVTTMCPSEEVDFLFISCPLHLVLQRSVSQNRFKCQSWTGAHCFSDTYTS
ncbi:Thioredoxin-like protein 1 [Homalodisca vitripennis]|nr:Thioredoxin-like protein 1 [Homalodisca vitripennis]